MYDLAGAIIIAAMFEEGGMIVTGDHVGWVTRQGFQKVLIEGYEKEGGKVDLQRLERMLLMKKHFYVSFVLRGLEEGNVPEQSMPYMEYMRKNFGKSWLMYK